MNGTDLIQGKSRDSKIAVRELEVRTLRMLTNSVGSITPNFCENEIPTKIRQDLLAMPFWDSVYDERKAIQHSLLAMEEEIDIAGSFSSGIPIVMRRESSAHAWIMDSRFTYSMWVDADVGRLVELLDLYDQSPPPVKHFMKALNKRITQSQIDGLWREHDLDVMTIDGVSAEDNFEVGIGWCNLWRVAKVEKDDTIVNERGDFIYDCSVTPVSGIAGYNSHWMNMDGVEKCHTLEGLNGCSQFLTNAGIGDYHNLLAHICRFHMGISSRKFEGQAPPQVGDVLIHFNAGGEFTRRETGETPTYEWSPDPFDELDWVLQFEELTQCEENSIFEHSPDDFEISGIAPCSFDMDKHGDPEVFSRDYGMIEVEGVVYFAYPSKEIMFETMLSAMVQQEDSVHPVADEVEDDEDWGRSSRFIPAWKDKRRTKLIDKSQGTVPHWSDMVRCRICNGNVKILLKEVTVTLIFDCPHCGEAESVDCSHLSSGAKWPDDKNRKRVDAK